MLKNKEESVKRQSNFTVYCHENKINNKKYFGITRQNPKRRWQNGRGYDKNVYFCHSILKYGWDGFEHIILLENLSYKKASEVERFLIKKYNTQNVNFGYNRSNGGEGGNIYSDESREKMRQSRLGKVMPQETREKISKALKGTNNPMYGKKLSSDARRKISKTHKGLKRSEETKRKMSLSKLGSLNYRSKSIVQYDKYGIFIKKWDCISTASKELNISQSTISSACLGLRDSAGGFLWRYFCDAKESIKPYQNRKNARSVSQYDLSGDLIRTWSSISDASRELSIDSSSIVKCCRGKYKTSGGYMWAYSSN